VRSSAFDNDDGARSMAAMMTMTAMLTMLNLDYNVGKCH